MEFVSGISLTCFASSYIVALAMELTRFLFRIRIRAAITIGMMSAGIIAHTFYLFAQSRIDLKSGVPLSSWDSWCLVAAWILVAAFLMNLIRNPQTPTGLIFLPIALVMTIAASFLHDVGTFSAAEARSFWRLVHGMSLLAGTVSVSIGFVAGILFLVESRRLKKKLIPERRFIFPSLERLQTVSERSLFVSACLLGLGVLSGIVINLADQEDPNAVVQWSDPVIWTSGILFVWMMVASMFSYFYKPARYGRKISYLVVASFLFLIMALGVALSAQHGGQSNNTNAKWIVPHSTRSVTTATFPAEVG